MPAVSVVIAAAFGYLALLFAIAHFGDRRARQGRSLIGSPWVYTLSMGVYCTAWTYFGSIGRAAASGLWFLPIYLGPTLAMLMAWTVLRKMISIARDKRQMNGIKQRLRGHLTSEGWVVKLLLLTRRICCYEIHSCSWPTMEHFPRNAFRLLG